MVTMKRLHLYALLWGALLIGQFILPLAWRSLAADRPTSVINPTDNTAYLLIDGAKVDCTMIQPNAAHPQ